MTEKSNGTTANYYTIPKGTLELQDLIIDKNMNGQDAECFRALYRKGEVEHSGVKRDTKKIVFYQVEELMRLCDTPLEDRPMVRVALRGLLGTIDKE